MNLRRNINQDDQSQSTSLQLLMLVLILLLVFLMAARSPGDPDMFWHLRAGEETIEGGKPLLVDTMSYTKLGERWVNHSWLSQVVIYLFYLLGGTFGLSLYVALLATLTMFVLYQTMHGGVFLRAGIIVLVCAVIGPVWSPRPQMFSLLLFAGLALWLQLYQQRKTGRLWILPILFILWSNLHGGYSFGFMLLGITLGGMIFDRILRPETDQTMTWREIGRLADWTAISLLAVLINPNGLQTWEIPFQTVGVAVTDYIQEWESLDFHRLSSMPYIVLLFGTIVALSLSERKASGPEIAGLVLFGISSLIAQRMVGLFAIYTAVVLSRHADDAIRISFQHFLTTPAGEKFERWRKSWMSRPIHPGVRRTVNLTLTAVLALAGWIKLAYVSSSAVVDANLATYYPVGAVNYLAENGTPGNILNDYGWGGYIDWHLRDYKIFVDGRTDLYGDDLFLRWMDSISAKPGWEKTLEEYNVSYILLPPDMMVVEEAKNAGWSVLYEDELSVLLKAE